MVRIILNYSCSPPQGKAAVFFKTGFDLPAAICYHQNAISGYDGIGRHARFRFSCRETCRFDPCYPHHVRRSKHRSVSALRRKLHYVSSFFLLNCDPLRWARSLVWKRFFQIKPAPLGFDLVPVKSKHRSVSALRRKLHYVSSFFLLNCDPLRWARSLVWKRFFQIKPAPLGFDLVPVKSKHRSVSALRRKLHYVSSFFLANSSLWETGSDYLLCPLSAQPKPGAAVRARECRKVFFRTMQRCFFRTTALLEIEGGQAQAVPARFMEFEISFTAW